MTTQALDQTKVPTATAARLRLSPQFSNMIPVGHNHARVTVKDGKLQFLPTGRKAGGNLPHGEVFADLVREPNSNDVTIVAIGLETDMTHEAYRATFGNFGWNILTPVDNTGDADVILETVEVSRPQVFSVDKDGRVVTGKRRGRKPKFVADALRRQQQAANAVLDGVSLTADLSVEELADQVRNLINRTAGGNPALARQMALKVGTEVIADVFDKAMQPEPITIPNIVGPKELS